MSKQIERIVGVCSTGDVNECHFCNYKTRSSTGIRLHLKMSHNLKESASTTDSIKSCHSCRKDFKNIKELEKHLKKECY